jgi:large subunit ribosomal protein L24
MNRLKVGDLVQVITGKDKGKQGKVTKIITDSDRVVVEGINTVTRNQKPTPRNQQGGQIKKDAPIHVSNVMPIDPTTGKPTRVKVKLETGEGGKITKTRVAKSGAAITAS